MMQFDKKLKATKQEHIWAPNSSFLFSEMNREWMSMDFGVVCYCVAEANLR